MCLCVRYVGLYLWLSISITIHHATTYILYIHNFTLSPGVQIIWSNSRCRLHTSAALQLQLFVSDLPLNQSEYTADTLSSNQNRVDHRKWNFNVIFTLAHL